MNLKNKNIEYLIGAEDTVKYVLEKNGMTPKDLQVLLTDIQYQQEFELGHMQDEFADADIRVGEE